MLFVLLFLAAFIYFILERKIKCSFIPGIAVTIISCYLIVRDFLYNNVFRGRYNNLLRSLGMGNVLPTRVLFMSVSLLIFVPVCVVILFFLGKLVGKAMFTAEKDGKGYNTAAKILYFVASAIVGISGIILIPYNSVFSLRAKISVYKKILSFARFFGISSFTRGMPLIIGIILLFISITCIVLICTKIPFFKNLKAKAPAVSTVTTNASGKNVFSLLGIIFSALGNLGTWITALVGILTWRKVYFYNGYGYTKVLCTLFLILMITGIVFLILGLAKLPAQKNGAKRIMVLIFSIILLVSSAIDSIWLILNAMQYVFKL